MTKKIKHCPNCNSTSMAEILYGMPALSDKLDKALLERKIVLGGCMVTKDDPDFQCNDCEALINSRTGTYTSGIG